jgi:FlaA1/EpsC-like NDP-sugar epimerase
MATHAKTFLPIAYQPGLHLLGKVLIDLFLAGLAWVAACSPASMHMSLNPPIHAIGWMVVALALNLSFQLHRQHYRFFGRRDLLRVVFATLVLALAVLLLTAPGAWGTSEFQTRALLLASLATGLLWLTFRLAISEGQHLWRSSQRAGGMAAVSGRPVLIVGAGHAGLLILEELNCHPELGMRVVGFVDDAPEMSSVRIRGIRILGTFAELPMLLKKHSIAIAILAIPSAPGQLIRHLTQVVTEAGVEARTVPGLYNLLGTQTWAPEIQEVAIEDLLRREPVQLDQSALGKAIAGSVVLVTGGGGSIGSELARQIAAFHPARIVLLGRGENSLWEAERQLRSLFPDQCLAIELCDIRNRQRLHQAFEHWQPGIVLHAAAHKHVPYLEAHPAEGVQNNVLGTWNVVQETLAIGAHTFVNISTDKAVNPTNVLGATKFLAECIVLDAAASALPHQRFLTVRFGNVLGSRGSVIPIFREQIKRGGPLTITHPAMTRYFMTIPEASQLVLQAGILGGNGKIFVLDMGEPVKISDLARDMARLSGLTVGRDIQIQVSGIRPGEKLFEEIFMEGEQQPSLVHPKVFEAARLPLGTQQLLAGLEALSNATTLPEGVCQREILHGLQQMVPTYHPSANGLGRFAATRGKRRSLVIRDGLDRRAAPGQTVLGMWARWRDLLSHRFVSHVDPINSR